MQKFKTALRFFLGFPLTFISLYFISNYIWQNWISVSGRIQSINPIALFAGLFFLFLFFLFRSLTWNKLLEKEGFSPPAIHSMYLLSVSEIKRYIPGSILGFISRINNFNSIKIPYGKVIKLIFYESLLFLISSAVISIPGLIFIIQKNSNIAPGLYPVVLFILTLAILPFFLSKRYNHKVTEIYNHLYLFKSAFIYVSIAWIFYALGSFLIGTSLNFLDPNKIVEISSFFVLSWLVGYLVLIAPLGLGVREAVVTYGLSFFMPVSIAAAIAIITRLGFVVSEIVFLLASFIFYKSVKIKQKIDYHLIILWSLITSYIAYFSYLSFEKHLNFFTGRFDLGNMDQTVWNTLSGRIFQFTNPDSTETVSRLAFHADFILILLAPFYAIWSDPRMLLLIQTVVIGLGAFFVYLIGKNVLKNKNLSLIFAASYLLNPFVQKQNLFDFHAVTLATTFLLAAFYFSYIKKYLIFFIFLVLAVLTKENIYLVSFLFGIYLAIKNKNIKWLGLSFISLIIFYLIVSKWIPAARGGAHFAVEYFSDFGNSPVEIVKNVLLNPVKTAAAILSPENISYLQKVFQPAGFLSFLSPLFLIFAGPDFMINLLSKNVNLKSINFHYAAVIIPFVYISAIFGAKFVLEKFKYSKTTTSVQLFILLSALYSTFQYGTLPGSKNPSLEIYNQHLPYRNEVHKLIRKIPEGLKVAATNNLGAHLSQRKDIYTIPTGIKEADVVLFLLNDPYAQPSPEKQREMAEELKNDPNYIQIYSIKDFVVFSKEELGDLNN